MPDTFNFCPNSNVPQTMPRDVGKGFTSNTGWNFSSRPTAPYQRTFKVALHGLRWFLDPSTGLYDLTTSPTINAAALEKFYADHETWSPFLWTHQHIGQILVRFVGPVQVPPGKENSGGFIDSFEIMLIEHNPGY